jgi:type IV secretion system protein VirB6
MDDAAPISWMLGQWNQLLTGALNGVSSQISSAITPLVAACFGIYMMLIAVNYARGAESEPIYDFALRCAAWALIIGLGLSASGYTGTVVPIVEGLGTDLANAASGGTLQEGALDKLMLVYLKIVEDGFTNADGIAQTILMSLKAAIVILSLFPFLIVATLTLFVTMVGVKLVVAVGPIYFGFLLFPATRSYFMSWLNAVWSLCLIPLFVAIVASAGVGLSQQMLGSSLGSDTTFSQVFLAGFCNLFLAVAVKFVAGLAQSLSSGGFNMGTMPGVAAAANAIRSFGRGTSRDLKGMREFDKRGGAALGALGAKLRGNSIRKAG